MGYQIQTRMVNIVTRTTHPQRERHLCDLWKHIQASTLPVATARKTVPLWTGCKAFDAIDQPAEQTPHSGDKTVPDRGRRGASCWEREPWTTWREPRSPSAAHLPPKAWVEFGMGGGIPDRVTTDS